MDVSGGREREVDGGEEEVRDCQRDDEHGGGMASKLGASREGHHCQQVTCKESRSRD